MTPAKSMPASATRQQQQLKIEPHTPRIDALIEVLMFALLAFAPAAFGAVNPWSELIVTALAGAIALCLLARTVLRRRSDRVIGPWGWAPIVLFLGVAFLQIAPLPTALVGAISPHTRSLKTELLDDLPDAKVRLARMTLSFYPPAARHDLRHVLIAATVFAAAATVYRDPKRMRRLLAGIAVIAFVLAALALAQDITGTHWVYWRVETDEPARSGSFFNHSHYAQFMNLSGGCALALLLMWIADARQTGRSFPSAWGRRAWAFALAATIVLGLLTISLSLSRGGVISLLLAGAFTFIALISARGMRWAGGVIAAIALIAFLALCWTGFDRVQKRMLERGGTIDRLEMVRNAGDIVRDFPQFGIGLGAFEWVFPMYQRDVEQNVATHVENEYVQTLVETGPAGIAAVLGFIGFVWWRWSRAARRADDRASAPGAASAAAAIGLSFGLVAVMLHSLSDFGQHVPAVANLSAVTCGLLAALGYRDNGPLPRARSMTATGFIALVVVTLVVWAVIDATRAWRSDVHFQEARATAASMRENDWKATPGERDALLAQSSAAIAARPDDVYIRYWCAVWHWRIERERYDRSDPKLTDAARAAVAELNAARACCPTFGSPYTVLGQLERNYLDLPIGITHIHTALRLAQNDGTTAEVAGEIDARRGRWDLAVPELRRAVTLDFTQMPDVCDLLLKDLHEPQRLMEVAEPSWYRMMFVSSAMQKIPSLGDEWKLAHARGADLLESDATVEPNGWKFATIAAYRTSLGRYENADENYRKALELEPTNLDWRLNHAELLRLMGRNDEAIGEAQAALRQHPNDPRAKKFIDELTAKLAATRPAGTPR